MQVEAIYDHGRLEFTHPMQLAQERLNLLVEVPDDEIANTANPYNLPQEYWHRHRGYPQCTIAP